MEEMMKVIRADPAMNGMEGAWWGLRERTVN